ncbi:hypothetical protein BJY01DRAFT_242797 [Aspergillus pseudoustus]|uniref:Rhodopsin domain-containing protein n=1 Tax=Aspergillus pseudoustus TaxID=1810923 RepID=A0ABR4KVZ7_9EURO
MAVEDRSYLILAISWPLCSICIVLVSLRIWVRTRLIPSFGWDDASITLALLCGIINSILITISAHHGTGRHASALTESQVLQSTKFNWLSQGFHVMSTNWGKVSVGLFLLRIIHKAKRHAPVMYGGLAFMTVVNAVCVYTIYGQCTPTARLWDSSIEGKCWDPVVQRDYAFFQGSISAFSDLVLAVYPLFTISRLQMALRLKIGLGILLSLGIIAMTAAIIKTINLSCLSARADYPWVTVDLVVWIAIEQYLIIIAACIPTLTPLVNIGIICGRLRGDNSSSNANPASRPLNLTKHLFSPITSAQADEVMYPLAWARSGSTNRNSGRAGSDSDSSSSSSSTHDGDRREDPVAVAREGRGILLTTEICVVSEYGRGTSPVRDL